MHQGRVAGMTPIRPIGWLNERFIWLVSITTGFDGGSQSVRDDTSLIRVCIADIQYF